MNNLKSELSKKNPYWLPRHRYLELKHFCLQYPVWEEAHYALISIPVRPNAMEVFRKKYYPDDPTERIVEAAEKFSNKMELVQDAADEADYDLSYWIVKGVSENRTYENLKTFYDIPCSRDTYYDRYRKFFFILNKMRD